MAYTPKKPRNMFIMSFMMFVISALFIVAVVMVILSQSNNRDDNVIPDKISAGINDTVPFVPAPVNRLENTPLNPITDDASMTIFPDDAFDTALSEIPKIPKPVSETPYMVPPVIASPNAPLWRKNAVSMAINPNQPMVAIVIDDLGIDKRRTRATIDLPAPITMAFLPYPSQLEKQTAMARSNGHELMVHVPMEPQNIDKNDPGPNALLINVGPEMIIKNLEDNLSQFDGYVGINNHMGSRFTADRNAMGPVLEELKRRGLLFLDSRTVASSQGEGLAKALQLPFAERDVFLDHDESREAVDAALAKTERIARDRGMAVAIGHPKDNTIAGLAKWIPEARERGIQIVPISMIARARMGELLQDKKSTSTKDQSDKNPATTAPVIPTPDTIDGESTPQNSQTNTIKWEQPPEPMMRRSVY